MTARSKLLVALLTAGILTAGLIGVFTAEGALPPNRIQVTLPLPRIDPFELLAREAADGLFRMGCLEVTVFVFPDPQGLIRVVASCTEWREVRPAAQ
ncbi:MAG: hypothetical protein HY725_22660 [Candidatus Rokubacteria bacterium]|nr:hypothetical protein [Candidatus Rokubacteria bacterium]